MNKIPPLMLLFLALLGFCSSHADCIAASDILSKTVVDEVYAKPKNLDVNKYSTYWVKSKLKLKAQDKYKIHVQDKFINLCDASLAFESDDATFVSSATTDVGIGGIYEVNGLSLYRGDTVSFSLEPLEMINFTKESCRKYAAEKDQNPDIYIESEALCTGDKSIVGGVFMLNEGDGASPSSNVILQNNAYLGGKKWSFFTDDTLGNIVDNAYINCKGALQGYDSLSAYERLSYNSKVQNMSISDLNKLCNRKCEVVSSINDDLTVTSYYSVSDGCFLGHTKEDIRDYNEPGYAAGLFAYLESTTGERQILPYKSSVLGSKYSGISLSEYEVTIQGPAQLYLYIDPLGSFKQGGYRVITQRNCGKHLIDSLYMYVGDNEPSMKPGDPGSEQVLYNETYSFEVSGKEGDLYYGIKDNGDGYVNNSGYFEISTKIPRYVTNVFSNIVSKLEKRINFILYGEGEVNVGAVGSIYRALTNDVFLGILRSAMVLSMMVYAIFYLMGLITTPRLTVIIIAVKLGVVAVLFTPDSFEFFNKHLFGIFKDGSSYLINVFSGGGDYTKMIGDDTNYRFFFVDSIVFRFSRSETWLQICAILCSGLFGFLIGIALLWSVIQLFNALFSATIMYLMAMIMIAILVSLTPLFVTFLLFSKTKAMFDSWLRTLAQIAMQPVAVFAIIALIFQTMRMILYSLFSFDICRDCAIEINTDYWGSLCIFRPYLPYGYSMHLDTATAMHDSFVGKGYFGLPIELSAFFSFVILSNALVYMSEQASTIVTSIFGAMGTEFLSSARYGGSIGSPANAARETLLGVVGMDQQTRQQHAATEHYKKLTGDDEARNVPESKFDKPLQNDKDG